MEEITNPCKQGNKKKTNQYEIHKANFRRVRKISSGLDTIGEYAHRAMRSSRGIERQGSGFRVRFQGPSFGELVQSEGLVLLSIA